MSPDYDELGCGLLIIAAIGIYVAYQHNWIDGWGAEIEPPPIVIPTPLPERPYRTEVWTTDEGSVATLLGRGEISGPRTSRRFWIRHDHTENSIVAIRSTSTFYWINCETSEYKLLSMVNYMPDGTVNYSQNFSLDDAQIEYVAPTSNFGWVAFHVCNERYD